MTTPGLNLDRIQIVLVEPLYGGNIGQVSRAMMNFGLSRLVLVNPREHLTAESYWMARDGKRIMDEAAVRPTLEAALEGVGLAVGTTRRISKYRRPALTPEELARDLAPLTAENDVALVFGREDSGLTAEELNLCQWIVSIPASERFPSLNLAQAVLLMGYVLFRSTLAPDAEAAKGAGASPRGAVRAGAVPPAPGGDARKHRVPDGRSFPLDPHLAAADLRAGQPRIARRGDPARHPRPDGLVPEELGRPGPRPRAARGAQGRRGRRGAQGARRGRGCRRDRRRGPRGEPGKETEDAAAGGEPGRAPGGPGPEKC